jgi:hypothetical protein
VTGPTEAVARFRAAAAGPGAIPWVLDLEALEEDLLLPMAAPADGVPAISLVGAKILARRLRDAVAANHQRALSRIDTDRRYPFDLHRLLPVPPSILALGPEEGVSRAWLRTHWGTPRPLRQVEALPGTMDRRRRKMAELRVGFWSADWSPWQAVARLRRAWPDLAFALQPDYAPGGSAPAERAPSSGSRARTRRG